MNKTFTETCGVLIVKKYYGTISKGVIFHLNITKIQTVHESVPSVLIKCHK